MMKSFYEWLQLQEGMSVYVQGFDFSNDVQDLDDLANWLKRKAVDPVWYKATKEEQAAVTQGGSLLHNILTPDGSYYSAMWREPEPGENPNIISFYIEGWSAENIQKILQGIKYHLDERKIKYGPFKREKSGMYKGEVYRIPILQMSKSNDAPPRLDMSNQNARMIFQDILNFPGEQGGFFGINPRDLLVKIDQIPGYAVDLHAGEPYMTKQKNGPTVFHGSLGSDDIRHRLEILRQIAQWAIEHDYDEIYVA